MAEAGKIWNDEGRRQLAEKLDKDVDDFIKKASKKKRTSRENLHDLEKDLNEHPAFINELPSNGDLPPLVEALQALKYDSQENTAEELAQNYKEDGNENFKYKKYRYAVASYTEGIKQDCANEELNSQLYGNRAAAHFELGNYKQSLTDCKKALRMNPNHLKALIRGIQCCISLKLCDEALQLCTDGLKKFRDNEKIVNLQTQVQKLKEVTERDKRKMHSIERKKQAENTRIWSAIEKRKIVMAERNDDDEELPDIHSFDSMHHSLASTKVHLDDDGYLIWPVVFFYPEYSQMDCIQKFHENSRFQEHLDEIFGPHVPTALWDENQKYKNNNLNVYFEDASRTAIVNISTAKTLLEVLQLNEYVIRQGTPGFLITVKNSEFEMEFLSKYE